MCFVMHYFFSFLYTFQFDSLSLVVISNNWAHTRTNKKYIDTNPRKSRNPDDKRHIVSVYLRKLIIDE